MRPMLLALGIFVGGAAALIGPIILAQTWHLLNSGWMFLIVLWAIAETVLWVGGLATLLWRDTER